MSPYVLLLIGLLLILLEFYLPGAVMGIAGALLVLASIIVYAVSEHTAGETVLFFILSCIAVAMIVRFALWQIRGTAKKKTIFLDDDQEGFHASAYDKDALGKVGTALSDLKPSGFVFVDGRQRQAISRSEYIIKGSSIEVIGGQGACLIVKKTNKDSHYGQSTTTSSNNSSTTSS